MNRAFVAAACLLALSSHAIPQETAPAKPAQDDAAAFGALPYVYDVALSADGKKLVGVAPASGTETLAFVLNLEAGAPRQPVPIIHADGQPMRLTHCDWSALDRVVCSIYGIQRFDNVLVPLTRLFAIDTEGKGKPLSLGQTDRGRSAKLQQFDGRVIDWLDGTSGKVLLMRQNFEELGTDTRTNQTDEGMSVLLMDTRTAKGRQVERAERTAVDFVADGKGTVRLKTATAMYTDDNLRGTYTHYYRTADNRDWKKLGTNDEQDRGMTPLAVDPSINAAYVLQPLNGRQALYRITLDGSNKTELVASSSKVDIDDVVRIGRNGRVIGVTWNTDRQVVDYFDPVYRDIAATLNKTLPALPLLRFLSASADEKTLLVWAGSDADPGHLYTFELGTQKLTEIMQWRPGLRGKKLSTVKSITYQAADGTSIPAYLTLPPGVTDAKGLPAIVMPHGGPESRDAWGFDWLSQYFAQRGFVVLQPNYRGSSGYGDQWLMNNGFKSWKTAVGDICDGGRWLVSQGMAAPAKLAIFGWSYGGYAALQANVLAPDLFKAVIAVAPVTDLPLMKDEALAYTSGDLVSRYVGDGPHLIEGSPARNAAAFNAPVLMFHGDMDINADIMQSRRMDDRLHDAGKKSELIVYPKLTHNLMDGGARADMLRRSDAFLRQSLGM